MKWYIEELVKQSSEDKDMENIALETVDLSLVRVKEVGAAWLVEASDHIRDNPSYIVNRFCNSGVIAAIDEAYGQHGSEDVKEEEVDDNYSSDDDSILSDNDDNNQPLEND